MSKAKLDVEESEYKEVEEEEITIDIILNPNDLSHPEQLRIFQMYNIHPSPLIRYAVLSGRFYKLRRGTYLPVEMRFGVSGL